MINIEIPAIKKWLYFPEELAECDGKQFLDLSKLLFWLNLGKIDIGEFRSLAVYALLGLECDKKESKIPNFIPEDEMKKWENVYMLSEYVDRFFHKEKDEDGNDKITLKQNFIKNHNPIFKLFGNFYGPDDAFENITFGQYMDGLDEFVEFSNSNDMKALRRLFSIFYLPKNEIYDKKKSFQRADGIFRTADVRWLYGFYLMFSAVNKYMTSGSVVVYGEEIDLRIIYVEVEKEKFTSDIPGLGWISTAHDLAESGVFGTYNEVRNTAMWRILMRLYEMKKKALDEKTREIAAKNKA